MPTKPQLAEDWDPEKVVFPVAIEPKYDGVRGVNFFGRMTGRSLKPFKNKHTVNFFSQAVFLGFDGELAANKEDHPRLCSLTTSATNTIEGTPWLMWHVFDYLRPETDNLAYLKRYSILSGRVWDIKEADPLLGAHLSIMPLEIVNSMAELEGIIAEHIDAGYEGTIIRDPDGRHKNGRSSPTHRGLLRIKSFIEVDGVVDAFIEGQSNNNVATINALGHTERSTHQENMTPNGMVGSMVCTLLEDAKHPVNGKVIHQKGDVVKFSAGRLNHDERKLLWATRYQNLGRRMKGRIFPTGVKDKPRFPTFQSWRSDEDTVDK